MYNNKEDKIGLYYNKTARRLSEPVFLPDARRVNGEYRIQDRNGHVTVHDRTDAVMIAIGLEIALGG